MPKTNHHFAAIEPGYAGSAAPTQAEIISALSFALDLTEGAVPGHALRSCLLGMRLGRALCFSDAELADLYHALLLKDVGCSSNAARMCQIIGGGDDRAVKSGIKLEDWTKPHKPSLSAMRLLWSNVEPDKGAMGRIGRILKIALAQHSNNAELIQLRCDRGASIVRKIGMSEQTALAVRSLDEHWDGSGYPDGLKGKAISPLARVMAIAQHLDVFALERGPKQAMLTLVDRAGRWFDPEMVRATASLHRKDALWMQCLPEGKQEGAPAELAARSAVLDLAPSTEGQLTASHIDQVCEAFAEVVDAKSHFTFRHSMGVTDVAAAIANAMGLSPARRQLLHRAALLHDLGKLRVPNSILDKPGKLDSDEWSVMREHPGLTSAILQRVKQFGELAYIAGAHHEKLDGSGYPDRLTARELSLEARILAAADVYGALTEDRPYRSGFSHERAMEIMQGEAGKLDPDCLAALSTMENPAAAAAPSWKPVSERSGHLEAGVSMAKSR